MILRRLLLQGALAATVLLLPLFAHAQTQKGATIVHFEGSISRRDTDETYANARVSFGHLLTNKLEFGGGAGVAKDPDYATSYGLSADVAYLFNMEPGKQKFVPRVLVGGGGWWGGDDTKQYVWGSLGTRYYINRSVGFSVSFFYERDFSDRYSWDYGQFGVGWGFFVQFGAGE